MKYSFFIVKLISLLMIGSAIFFTINVINMKNKFSTAPSTSVIQSGVTGEIIKVIDGDELVFKDESGTTTVRILGIKSFDTSVNDPQTESIAGFNLLYLKNKLKNKEVSLVFDKYKRDKLKRLLSYVHLEKEDIGQELIKQGLAPAYTKYPFSREASYIKQEEEAKKKGVGLWGSPKLVNRVNKLKQIWQKNRK